MAQSSRLIQTESKEKVSLSFFLKLFVPFALAFFMSGLLRTINNVLSPVFIETFNMSASDLGIMTIAYFFSFALAQIPLGVLLDRYGPGLTLSIFMLFAVIGCFIFAAAPSIIFLFIGRALVGLGVSGCLMAAYKAFGIWLPKDRLPMYNSLQSFVGGVGGMVATTPINLALDFMSWRMVFVVLGILTFIIATLVYLTPRHPEERNTTESIGEQLKGTLEISITKRFWRLAPLAVLGQSIYLALNSLWIGPWYRDVAGYSPDSVPNLLFLCALSITVGYLVSGVIANALKARFGIKVINITIVTMAIYTAILGLIIILPEYGNILWPAFVLFGPFSLLTYPIFSSMFDEKLSGRVQTTYNMIVFVMSTVIQSGMGAIIDIYEPVAGGGFNPKGYTVSLSILVTSLVISILWVIFYRRNKETIDY